LQNFGDISAGSPFPISSQLPFSKGILILPFETVRQARHPEPAEGGGGFNKVTPGAILLDCLMAV